MKPFLAIASLILTSIVALSVDGQVMSKVVVGGHATSSVGPDLWISAASQFTSGTYKWGAFGTNTKANDGTTGNPSPSLMCTYVSDSRGCYEYLAINASNGDLTSNLTSGQLYQLQFDAIINTGSATVGWTNSAYIYTALATISGTSWTTSPMYTVYFTADSASLDYISENMGAGQIVHFDNMHIRAY